MYSEIIEGDAVSLTNGTLIGTMANKNAGENKSVTITGSLGLDGTDAGNYELTQPTFDNVTVNITKKSLSVEGDLKADDKVYDGTTDIVLNTAELELTETDN